MITNISLVTVYCLDQDQAREFYVNILGFQPRTDATVGEDFRWVTVSHPDHPELQITLMKPGPPLDPDTADFIRRQLGKGQMGGLGLRVDDCRKTYDELSAKGVSSCRSPPIGPTALRPSCATTRATGWCWSSPKNSRRSPPQPPPMLAAQLLDEAWAGVYGSPDP
ncbi:MAG: VOC family protein [Pseudonocardiaceae bacterium]